MILSVTKLFGFFLENNCPRSKNYQIARRFESLKVEKTNLQRKKRKKIDWREWRNSETTAQKVCDLYDDIRKKLQAGFAEEDVLKFIEKKFRVS